jgi:hypothetical protein
MYLTHYTPLCSRAGCLRASPTDWRKAAFAGRPARPSPRCGLQKYSGPDAQQQIADTRLHRRARGQPAQAEPITIT